jgi:hypothetical protein
MKTLHRTIRGARVGVRSTYLKCGRKGAPIARFISAPGSSPCQGLTRSSAALALLRTS